VGVENDAGLSGTAGEVDAAGAEDDEGRLGADVDAAAAAAPPFISHGFGGEPIVVVDVQTVVGRGKRLSAVSGNKAHRLPCTPHVNSVVWLGFTTTTLVTLRHQIFQSKIVSISILNTN